MFYEVILMKRKILIVEDDKDLNETLSDFLEIDFEVKSVFDGESGVNEVYENHFDLIILDVKLPKLNGFEVSKEIRKFSDVPIIFLTSLDSENDIKNGFLSGGDDYIKKPFSLVELKFRIEAILKRVYQNQDTIKIGDYIFDTQNLELYKENQKIHLKPKELKLLSLFLKNKNKILDKEFIFNEIYEYDEVPNDNSLRVFIRNLRQILGNEVIETIKNVGYKFVS